MTDKGTIRIVVVFLGIITVTLIAGAFALVLADKAIPDPIWGLSGGALGAFTAMLASTRSGEAPQPVNVVNEARDPVPVELPPAPPAR